MYVFFNVTGGNTCLDLLFVFIDASQTVCKVMCLLFVEIDDFDVTETENMHCAKLPDAQDDRICSYTLFDSSRFIHSDFGSSPVKKAMPTGEHCWKKSNGAPWARTSNL